MLELSEPEFERRLDRLTDRFDHLGDLSVIVSTPERQLRRLHMTIEAPGSGLVALAIFEYTEWYRGAGTKLQLAKYHYNFHDRARGGWYGFHLHDLRGHRAVAHLHCVEPDGRGGGRHYRHYGVDILEAHEDFERLYAGEDPIRCVGLRELSPEHL